MKNLVVEPDWLASNELLMFDTCRTYLCAALGRPADLNSVVQPGRNRSSVDLVPMIQSLLAERKVKKPSGIAVTVGPGSFTGTRIGVSTARNLGMLWSIPVIPIFSLQLYAESILRLQTRGAADGEEVVHPQPGRGQAIQPFVVSLDGKQNRFYSLLVRETSSVFQTMPEQLMDWTPAEMEPDTVIYCDAPDLLKERLPQKEMVRMLPQPDPESFFRLMEGGAFQALPYESVIPVYVRKDPATARYPRGFQHKPASE